MSEAFIVTCWVIFGLAELGLFVYAWRGRKVMIAWERRQREEDREFFRTIRKECR